MVAVIDLSQITNQYISCILQTKINVLTQTW